MATLKSIRRRFGDNICRHCINDIYGTAIPRSDCVYGYKADCPHCGEYQNIVVKLRLSARLKLWRK